MFTLSNKDFIRLVGYVKNNYGINLEDKKVLIEGRLSSVIREKNFPSFTAYIDALTTGENDEEISLFLNKITTNYTYFLREMEHFSYLKNTILPYLEETVKNKDIRIWSAGCSSGQEAYTIAMLIDEFFGTRKQGWDTTILATDISQDALRKAKLGIYTKDELKDMPPQWFDKYFTPLDHTHFRICDRIRREVVFKSFNLMDPIVAKKPFHLIFCRNVMIYYDKPTKDALIERFYEVLEKGGYLCIGHSESVNKETTKFQFIQPAIYRKEIRL